ncbi:AAA family ATPase [Micrococcaceae sp. AOP34-BR2-30]
MNTTSSAEQTTSHVQDKTTTIELGAQITLIDSTGTRVAVTSVDQALEMIASRPSTSPTGPRLALAMPYYEDPFFHPMVWTIRDRTLLPAEATTPVNADYYLEYQNWTLTDESGHDLTVKAARPDTMCQIMANRTHRTVTVTSTLPGVATPAVYTPDNAETDDRGQLATDTTGQPDTSSEQVTTELSGHATDNSVRPRPDTMATPVAEKELNQSTSSDQSDLPRTRREARQSFLSQVNREEPATQGFRGLLTRLGVRVSPSASERAERADELAVSQHWPGPRTIAVVNGKGGAGKTPTTICLSSVFARFGGGGVLAWDNNQTRGTLGWRTEQGPHESTLLELLPETDRLLATGAQSADLAHFVHHQTADRFDVLRSKPSKLADQQRFDASDVERIHQVASKFYRLIIIDSGNDESDPLWRAMIEHTDQLVVATTTSDEKAEAGALLLEDLAESSPRGRYLADNAVVVVSQAEQNAKPHDLQQIASGFAPLARDVATIPHDPAMVDGHLSYQALRPATQRAWLAAGAAVARGL